MLTFPRHAAKDDRLLMLTHSERALNITLSSSRTQSRGFFKTRLSSSLGPAGHLLDRCQSRHHDSSRFLECFIIWNGRSIIQEGFPALDYSNLVKNAFSQIQNKKKTVMMKCWFLRGGKGVPMVVCMGGFCPPGF